MKRFAFLFVLALTVSAFAEGLPKDPQAFFVRIAGKKSGIMPGQLLVKYRPSYAASLAQSVTAQKFEAQTKLFGGQFRSRIAHTGWTLWTIPSKVDPRVAAKMLKGDPNIAYAQPVHRVFPLWTDPNDPDFYYMEDDEELIMSTEEIVPFRRLWHLVDTMAVEGWSDFPNMWYTAANKPVDTPLIAVIDTGADMNHPDFINAGGMSSDVGAGGQLVHALSKQFRFGELDPAGSPEDAHGHGTHVLGLAVASGNNGGFDGKGVIGTGYNSKGMMLRVFDSQGVGTDADAAAAIFYAADNGADIINLSIGTEDYSQLFQDAVTHAWQKGCLVIAAGNEDGNGGGDLGPIYPAACSGAMGVSANGPDYVPAVATYSGFGRYVDIAAPGGDVLVFFDGTTFSMTIQFVWSTAMRTSGTLNQHPILNPPYKLNYAYLAGTSMAAPQVAGAAGLYYGKYGLRRDQGWVNVQAYRALQKSAIGVMGAPNGGWEPYQGYGSLNIEGLLFNSDERGALVGAIEGMVYSNATPVANVQVRATKGGPTFSTTTGADGTYRFDQMPPGEYTVSTAPFGQLKAKKALVKAGSDFTGCDFWCGTFTWDETPPTVARFITPAVVDRGEIQIVHWGYDTETGLDSFKIQIGSAPGEADIYPLTEIVPDTNRFKLLGLNLRFKRTYYIKAIYRNGAGMETVVNRTFKMAARR
ncbi:MAG TPA: S8 family serine peptidase [Fimbriimonadaceae bacterium]|nr:S8 family serine peptidase [Fimbriimonadaceae bacterium]